MEETGHEDGAERFENSGAGLSDVAISQGMLETTRSWKRQERILPWTLQRECDRQHLDFGQ